jgi:hypothetical protein
MAKRTATFEFEQRRFNAASKAFLRRLPAEAIGPAVRKLAFDVVAETVRGITFGLGGPARVDTGRYRAAWRAGFDKARVRGKGLRTTATVTNNVEYGPFVEFGTSKMAAGNHLTRALAVVRRDLPAGRGAFKVLADLFAKLWNGR